MKKILALAALSRLPAGCDTFPGFGKGGEGLEKTAGTAKR